MSVDQVVHARAVVDDAMSVLRREAKDAINSTVFEILDKYPDIKVVSWAQKSGEYNDEGLYPGITGPVINSPGVEDDEYQYPNWLYDYRSSVDPRLNTLVKVLDSIGEEVLSEIFEEEATVDCRLVNGKVVYETEYAGC